MKNQALKEKRSQKPQERENFNKIKKDKLCLSFFVAKKHSNLLFIHMEGISICHLSILNAFEFIIYPY